MVVELQGLYVCPSSAFCISFDRFLQNLVCALRRHRSPEARCL